MLLFTKLNLPILLTLVRLCGSPLILPFLIVYLLPFNFFWLNSVLAFLFILFSVTDFFDGYFARKYNQVSVLGKVLDPIADKFLLYATLVALLTVGKIHFFWVILLIGREFFMMGLRQLALEYNFSISVFFMAKIKTAFQMICLTFLIMNPYQLLGFYGAMWWNGIELFLLSGSIIFSLITAYQYYLFFVREYVAKISFIALHEE